MKVDKMDEKFIEERLKHEHSESLMFDKILVLEQQLHTTTEQLSIAREVLEKMIELKPIYYTCEMKRMADTAIQALAKIEEVK